MFAMGRNELKREWTKVLGGGITMFLCVGLNSSYGIINVVLLNRFQGTTAATSTIGALFISTGHILGKEKKRVYLIIHFFGSLDKIKRKQSILSL